MTKIPSSDTPRVKDKSWQKRYELFEWSLSKDSSKDISIITNISENAIVN